MLGNDMLTAVRRRVSWGTGTTAAAGRPSAGHRLLLLCGYNTLSDGGRAKLKNIKRTGPGVPLARHLPIQDYSTTPPGARREHPHPHAECQRAWMIGVRPAMLTAETRRLRHSHPWPTKRWSRYWRRQHLFRNR